MSANGDGNGDDGDGGPGTREVAYRLFAAEFDDCDFQFSESDEERAPNYVITPTGGRVNRMFLVGVLTELEQVNESMLRARIVDPTGAFVVYAGQYQPEALSFLERTEPPAFLAVTGKARTYQPEDSDIVYSSVRPESISRVDAETRDRWVVSTAEQTLERIGVMASAVESGRSGEPLREHLEAEGVDPAFAQGIALAREHYGTTPAYLDALHDLSLDAARVVANERDEAGSLDLTPGEGGEADLDALQSGDAPAVAAGDESTTAEASTTTETATGEGTATSSTDTRADTGESGSTATATADTGTDDTTVAESTGDEASAAGSTPAEGSSTAAAESAQGQETTEAADTTATAADSAEGADDLGEFEPGDFDAEDVDEDPLGEDVREEVEEEYGTEFSTGSEVESEPDLEPDLEPDDEPATDAASAAETEPEPDTVDTEPEPETTDTEPDTESEGTEPGESETTADSESADAEPAEDVDLETAVMDAMQALDDGDGAPTDEVVERVADRTGASTDEVDAAVQDALMGGQCYEPEDGRLKPI